MSAQGTQLGNAKPSSNILCSAHVFPIRSGHCSLFSCVCIVGMRGRGNSFLFGFHCQSRVERNLKNSRITTFSPDVATLEVKFYSTEEFYSKDEARYDF